MENIFIKYKSLLIGIAAVGALATVILITNESEVEKKYYVTDAVLSGDSMLFERGKTYYGEINVSKSNMVLAAYGEGSNPVISGFYQIQNFTNLGSNIYESEAVPGGLTNLNLVTVNGTVTGMGRYPNADALNGGYLTFETSSGKTSITDNELSSSPSWTGATLVIRTTRWVMDRWPIKIHSGHTIYYTGGISALKNLYGYFIENDPKTLNKNGEWFWNPATKKLRFYWEGSLPVVKVSTQSFLINSSNKSNVSIRNLVFEGANDNSINFNGGTEISMTNFAIRNSGNTGIKTFNTTNITFDSILVDNSLNNGIDLAFGSNNIVLRNYEVRNTYMIAGMGQGGEAKGLSINARGTNTLIENGKIINSGFIPFYFSAVDYVTFQNNLIDSFCITKDDGAAVYTWTGGGSRVYNKGRIIRNNIIKNGISAVAGQPSQTLPYSISAYGIYLDVNASNVEVKDNYIENPGRAGIYLRPLANNNNVSYNTVVGGYYLLYVVRDEARDCYSNIVKNNILFATAAQTLVKIENFFSSIRPTIGVVDSNIYVAIKSTPFSIRSVNYNFPGWKATTLFDDNSIQKVLSSADITKIVSTAQDSLQVETDDYKWHDLNDKLFVNPLAPYSSAILIRGDKLPDPEPVNQPPVVSLSTDNTSYTAPARIRISAAASDTDGTVSKVQFLFNGKHLYYTYNAPYTCLWSNVKSGTYALTAKATDNNNNVTISNSISITVK